MIVNARFARVMALAALGAAIAAPVMTILIWIFWDQLAPHAAGNLHRFFDLSAVGPGARLTGFGLSMLGALISAYGFLGLRLTFNEASQSRALSNASLRGFRRFAWVSLFLVIFQVIQRTGLIALFSYSDPAHPSTLSIQIGAPELKAAFMALLLVFTATVFTEAKRVKDENDSFL